MSKELYVSSTTHETKVALVEDDQLSEIYFERENEYTLAGSIYKGRVTRVLPGMQSAFVNIGLERDAFLYVSDFIELEDEDEAFEAVNVRSHRNAVGVVDMTPAEAPAHGEGAAVEFTGGYDEAPQSADSGPRAESDENGRPWRGRRRRRGGRGRRGFEGKFDENRPQSRGESAAPAGEPNGDAEEFVEGPSHVSPLPGESLAKGRAAEHDNEPDVLETEESASTEVESPITNAEEHVAQPPSAVHGADEQRVVLPGESFGPRAPRSESTESRPPREERPSWRDRFRFGRGRGRDRDRDRGAPRERSERPAAEFTPPPPGYQPIILPGESLSKYKRGAAGQSAEHSPLLTDESPVETMQHGEPPVIEAPAFQQEYAETPVRDIPSSDREVPPEMVHLQPASGSEQGELQEIAAERSRDARQQEEEDRFRTMNVAEVFGGGEAEREDSSEESAAGAESSIGNRQSESQNYAEPALTGTFSDAGSAIVNRQPPIISSTGSFEEEEIEDEETELTPYAEQFDDDEFEELEEETLEPAEFRAAEAEGTSGEMLAESSEENGGEESAEQDEFEEQELSGEETAGRAELRAPAGTAAYQQRSQRPQFDPRRGQRDRSRRGGPRRPRGGPRMDNRPHVMISDVLKEGQEILVQIAKEPIGKKGARITSHIALPGRFLVYMPTVNHTGVSRKIASDEERQRLKRIISGERENGHGGFIVRTAAEGVSESELKADIHFLINLWNEIKNRADNGKAPSLIYHDLNLVERILRDLVTEDFSAIWMDTEQEYERVLRFVNRFQPALVRRVKLYTKETPLFEQFGIQEEINKALKSKVWLKSGGYIVINQTEALVAIDVNTGKYVGKTQRLEDTIVKTNVDAIKEIVRQIRLRDLGGIIVIDFIDMDERRNRQKVMQALEDALRSDRSPSKVLQFNDFGLVAITRKRVKHSLERTLGEPCPYCTGTGLVKSVETVCNEIYIEMKKMARHLEGRDVMLRVNPEVAKALKENNGRWLSDYEELTGRTVIVKSDALLHQEQFDMH